MQVRDLIEKLKEYPEDLPVALAGGSTPTAIDKIFCSSGNINVLGTDVAEKVYMSTHQPYVAIQGAK